MHDDSRPAVTDVFLYLRKSTSEAEERQIRSIDDQRQDCLTLAERLNLTIVDEFIEARSASRPNNRPVFKSMLKELSYKDPKRRRAEGILAWHPDRLTRNALEAGQIIQMVDDEQINDLFFPAYNFHNDTSGKEHLTIEFARAKGYTDRLSEVVCRGVNGREKEGAMIYPVKYGYQKRREIPENPAKCSLFPIPHPEQFDIAKRTFALALEGHGVRRIHAFLMDEFPERREHILALSTMDRALRDSFYCGHWGIMRGKKTERIIDLSEITLADGTTFEPIISMAEFEELQVLRGGKRTHPIRRNQRRINPFPGLVHCATCERKMYPSYRKIKRADSLFEEQLGYECQSKSETGTRCLQSRIRADVLYGHAGKEIEAEFPRLSKPDYHRYLFSMNAFLARKSQTVKQEASRINRSLVKIRAERRKIIEQRAALVSAKAYDKDSKAHYESRLKELATSEENLTCSRTENSMNIQNRVISCRKFLELLAKLHPLWLAANPAQKGEISKILFLNLSVKGQETHSISWNPLIMDGHKERNLVGGGPQEVELEPRFERWWHALGDAGSAVVMKGLCAVVGVGRVKMAESRLVGHRGGLA